MQCFLPVVRANLSSGNKIHLDVHKFKKYSAKTQFGPRAVQAKSADGRENGIILDFKKPNEENPSKTHFPVTTVSNTTHCTVVFHVLPGTHAYTMHTHSLRETLGWLKWRGLQDQVLQSIVCIKPRQIQYVEGRLACLMEAHHAAHITGYFTLIHPLICHTPPSAPWSSSLPLCVLCVHVQYSMGLWTWGCTCVCLLSLLCNALSESGHAVRDWWWWWLSNVRMSPESGNCDCFSVCSFLSTLHYCCLKFLLVLLFSATPL